MVLLVVLVRLLSFRALPVRRPVCALWHSDPAGRTVGLAPRVFCTIVDLLRHLARQTQTPAAVHVFGVILLAGALLLSFTFVDERLSRLVNRWLFRPPDYRAATRGLANRLGQLQLEPEIAAAAEDAVARCPAIERRTIDRVDQPACVAMVRSASGRRTGRTGSWRIPVRGRLPRRQCRSADPGDLRRTHHACSRALARSGPSRDWSRTT